MTPSPTMNLKKVRVGDRVVGFPETMSQEEIDKAVGEIYDQDQRDAAPRVGSLTGEAFNPFASQSRQASQPPALVDRLTPKPRFGEDPELTRQVGEMQRRESERAKRILEGDVSFAIENETLPEVYGRRVRNQDLPLALNKELQSIADVPYIGPIAATVVHGPEIGGGMMTKGAEELFGRGNPWSQRAGGAGKIIAGGMQMMGPALPALTAAAPAAMAGGMIGGTVGHEVASKAVEIAGAPVGWQELAGEVGGLVGGAGGAKVGHKIVSFDPIRSIPLEDFTDLGPTAGLEDPFANFRSPTDPRMRVKMSQGAQRPTETLQEFIDRTQAPAGTNARDSAQVFADALGTPAKSAEESAAVFAEAPPWQPPVDRSWIRPPGEPGPIAPPTPGVARAPGMLTNISREAGTFSASIATGPAPATPTRVFGSDPTGVATRAMNTVGDSAILAPERLVNPALEPHPMPVITRQEVPGLGPVDPTTRAAQESQFTSRVRELQAPPEFPLPPELQPLIVERNGKFTVASPRTSLLEPYNRRVLGEFPTRAEAEAFASSIPPEPRPVGESAPTTPIMADIPNRRVDLGAPELPSRAPRLGEVERIYGEEPLPPEPVPPPESPDLADVGELADALDGVTAYRPGRLDQFKNYFSGDQHGIQKVSQGLLKTIRALASPSSRATAVANKSGRGLIEAIDKIEFPNVPEADASPQVKLPEEKFRAILTQDNLEGVRRNYLNIADRVQIQSPGEFAQSWDNYLRDGILKRVLKAVGAENVTETIKALDQKVKLGEAHIPEVQREVNRILTGTALNLPELPIQQWTGKTMAQWYEDPGLRRAVEVYKLGANGRGGYETAFLESASSSGRSKRLTGKLDAYMPLTIGEGIDPTSPQAKLLIRGGFELEPQTGGFRSQFATGLAPAERYDFSMRALNSALEDAFRGGTRKQLETQLHKIGLFKEIPREDVDTFDASKPMEFMGHEYQPAPAGTNQPGEFVLMDYERPATVNYAGDHVPATTTKIAMPTWVAKELGWNGKTGSDAKLRAFHGDPLSTETIPSGLRAKLVAVQLFGPAEALLHSSALARPYATALSALDKGISGKAIGMIPLGRMIKLIARAVSDKASMKSNPDLFQEGADAGYFHRRTLKVVKDPTLQRALGTQEEMVNMLDAFRKDTVELPEDLSITEALKHQIVDRSGMLVEGAKQKIEGLLFSENGSDTRLRMGLLSMIKDAYPDVPLNDPTVIRMMETMIDYNRLTQAGLVKRVQTDPVLGWVAPFMPAGWTRIANLGRTLTFQRPVIGDTTVGKKITQDLSTGLTNATLQWIAWNWAITGINPLEDPEARLFEIRVPGDSDVITQAERVASFVTPGSHPAPLFGVNRDKTKSIYLSMDLIPAANMTPKAFKSFGVSIFADTLKQGGSLGQASEAAAIQLANTAMSIVHGPAMATAEAITGYTPYITNPRDPQTGESRFQFMPLDHRTDSLFTAISSRFGEGMNPLTEAYFTADQEKMNKSYLQGEPFSQGADLWKVVFKYLPAGIKPYYQDPTARAAKIQKGSRVITRAEERTKLKEGLIRDREAKESQ